MQMKKVLLVAYRDVKNLQVLAGAAHYYQIYHAVPVFFEQCVIEQVSGFYGVVDEMRELMRSYMNFDHVSVHISTAKLYPRWFDLVVCMDSEALIYMQQARLENRLCTAQIRSIEEYKNEEYEEVAQNATWFGDKLMFFASYIVAQCADSLGKNTRGAISSQKPRNLLIIGADNDFRAPLAFLVVNYLFCGNIPCASATMTGGDYFYQPDAIKSFLKANSYQISSYTAVGYAECTFFDLLLCIDAKAKKYLLKLLGQVFAGKVAVLDDYNCGFSDLSTELEINAFRDRVGAVVYAFASPKTGVVLAQPLNRRGRRFLLTSDFHGNPLHVYTLFTAAGLTFPDVFVYLGDISPVRTVFGDTESYFRIGSELFAAVQQLQIPLKFVMPGNTDYGRNMELWEQEFKDERVCRFCRDCTVYFGDLRMIFLATISATTHCLKDCEALERGAVPFNNMSYVFYGYQREPMRASDGIEYGRDFEVYQRYDDVPETHKKRFEDTIYDRLARLSGPAPQVIFSHAPPYKTHCDALFSPTNNKKSYHVGSKDLCAFLEEDRGVCACFSGHIHQAPFVSGTFADFVEETACYSVGNTGIDFYSSGSVWYLVWNADTNEIARFCVQCPVWEFGLNRKFRK